VALPRLAASVVATVDRDLAAVARLDTNLDAGLVDVLERARRELATVHLYEVLAGMLLHPRPDAPPVSLVALHALGEGRGLGLTDDEIVARSPVVLVLLAPSLTPAGALPATVDDGHVGSVESLEALDDRDALRLRTRWLQELTARVALELGRRLHRRSVIGRPELVGDLRLDELAHIVRDGDAPADLAQRAAQPAGPSLPPAFRLDAAGRVHAVRTRARPLAAGLPASAGRAVGEARHHIALGQEGQGLILVTRHLEPQLAPLLPGLAGLVAETGSALSHLAILAREQGVPAVVGVDGALERFPPGTRLLIDGSTGEVEVIDDRDREVER
jgi:pyruvate,water dikinase